MNTPSSTNEDKPLYVRRGRVESVDLYEVKDSELDLLEKGSPATIQLNFAVFLLSIAFSSIAALCTATFEWDTAKTVFVIISVVGILMGGYLLISWWRSRSAISTIVDVIRNRIVQPDAENKDSMPATTISAKPGADHQPSG